MSDPEHEDWPEHWGYPRVPGMIYIALATYVEGKGWLTIRRGASFVLHGEPSTLLDGPDTLVELQRELRNGLVAMRHRLKNPQ